MGAAGAEMKFPSVENPEFTNVLHLISLYIALKLTRRSSLTYIPMLSEEDFFSKFLAEHCGCAHTHIFSYESVVDNYQKLVYMCLHLHFLNTIFFVSACPCHEEEMHSRH